MAATVLGKRQRGPIATEEYFLRSGSKRRRVPEPRIHNEGEDHPSILSTSRFVPKTSYDADPQQENGASAEAGNRRSKRIVRDNTLSPSTIQNHFRVSKPVTDENAPPKEWKTPQSSRFRDALGTSPPVTPSRRVQVGGKVLTPRTSRTRLTPRTPRHASTPMGAHSVYTPARKLFARSINPIRLVGRDKERGELAFFIQDGFQKRKGGCMYVSGPPGTGKSALVDEVCRELDPQIDVKCVRVNCASMRNARDIYGKLIEDLCQDSQVFRMSQEDRLKAIFVPAKKSADLFLITLDEIDHLLTIDPEILYSLFEWSLHSKSHLLLIGIANALDLTDRFLPRLKANNLRPRLLPFLPYSAPQIANVITTHLQSLLPNSNDESSDFVPFLHPAAIQLCAKKVASQTGDLRKAFELVRRAIDSIEQETQQKLDKADTLSDKPTKIPLLENMNLTSPPKTPALKPAAVPSYTALTAPRASIAHVARISSAVFGQGTSQRLQGLNLQQKAAICALIALDKLRRNGNVFVSPSKAKSAAPTIKQLFDTYCTLCRIDNVLHPLTNVEFKDVIGSLETMGLVGEFHCRNRGGTLAGGSGILRTPSKSNGPSTPRKSLDETGLVCFVTEKEVENQISGPGESILRSLLRGEGI